MMCQAAGAAGARRVVPVGPPDVIEALHRDAVEVVCLHTQEQAPWIRLRNWRSAGSPATS
jgi:predicted phosphoribosyltransferase